MANVGASLGRSPCGGYCFSSSVSVLTVLQSLEGEGVLPSGGSRRSRASVRHIVSSRNLCSSARLRVCTATQRSKKRTPPWGVRPLRHAPYLRFLPAPQNPTCDPSHVWGCPMFLSHLIPPFSPPPSFLLPFRLLGFLLTHAQTIGDSVLLYGMPEARLVLSSAAKSHNRNRW